MPPELFSGTGFVASYPLPTLHYLPSPQKVDRPPSPFSFLIFPPSIQPATCQFSDLPLESVPALPLNPILKLPELAMSTRKRKQEEEELVSLPEDQSAEEEE